MIISSISTIAVVAVVVAAAAVVVVVVVVGVVAVAVRSSCSSGGRGSRGSGSRTSALLRVAVEIVEDVGGVGIMLKFDSLHQGKFELEQAFFARVRRKMHERPGSGTCYRGLNNKNKVFGPIIL